MTVAQFVVPLQQFLDANGNPIAGAKIYSYQAGTSTPKAMFQDSGGLTAHAHPALADASGRLLAYLTEGEGYKFNVTTALDVQVAGWPVDNVYALGISPATITKYATADVICSTITLGWDPTGTSTFIWHWTVPPEWVPGTGITFASGRRAPETGTTAKMAYSLIRLRNGLLPLTISAGIIDFAPSISNATHDFTLGFTTALIQHGDKLSINITRAGNDAADTMTVVVAYDGNSIQYTAFPDR